jgi:VCBS repeat-containing protein
MIQSGFTLRVPAATGVLANDTDAENDPLTASLAYGQPQHGTVALAADGSFVYTPNAGFTGTDSFYYAASDQYAQGNVAVVTITVVAGPSPVIPPSKGKIPTPPPVVIPASKGVVVTPPAPLLRTAAVVGFAAAPAKVAITPAVPMAVAVSGASAATPVSTVTTQVAAIASTVAAPASVQAVPQSEYAALMLPPVPAVQRLPAALKSLLDAVKAPPLDAIFFDPMTGAIESGTMAADSGGDWLMFDPTTVTKHRRINWEART